MKPNIFHLAFSLNVLYLRKFIRIIKIDISYENIEYMHMVNRYIAILYTRRRNFYDQTA